METNTTSFASPLASLPDTKLPTPSQIEYVIDAISNASLWAIPLTVLAVLVAYDQGM